MQNQNLIPNENQQHALQRYSRMRDARRTPLKGGMIAYSGTIGSFAEEAAVRFFGENSIRIAHKSFEDVFKSITGGACDYGVLPIENSSTGAINAVYDLLTHYEASIVGEINLAVRQCLLALPGTKLTDIKTIYSHEQGFFQSKSFLDAHPNWLCVPYHNTAVAAKYVHDSGDKTKAAIASRRAAVSHGLDVLVPDINTANGNTTRFCIVSAVPEKRPESNKMSIIFTLPHVPGALYRVLGIFARRQLDMVKIESRPIPERHFDYRFFLDFVGDISDTDLDEIIHKVILTTNDFYFLGNYPSAD